jgi:hypothetical protein
MQNLMLSYNPLVARFALLIGGLLVIVIYLFYHAHRGSKTTKSAPTVKSVPAAKTMSAGRTLFPTPTVSAEPTVSVEPTAAAGPGVSATESPKIFEHQARSGSSMLRDAMRAALILLAICVAGGFVLILVPQGSVDRMAQDVRVGRGQLPAEERISLLYLGDETQGKQFHIRGVIRNISTQPIEKLDAMVRLYAQDGSLLETAVIRLDAETIAPDATSTFNLSYPDYAGQFGSYSVDFKFRRGEPAPFKDMRRGG